MEAVQAKVLAKTELSSRVVGVILKVPLDYVWLPGQHLAVQGPSKPNYYSIASAPSPEGLLELAVGPSEDAPAFTVGSSLRISPPGGRAAVSLEAPRSIIMIGMGTGIAPLRAVIQEQTRLASCPRLTLLYGSRDEESQIYAREFEELSAAGLLDYRPVLSQPRGEWPGLRGRVQQHVEQLPQSGDCYAICGSKSMVEDIAEVLSRRGAPEEALFVEGY